MERLENKIAVITGASTGIGQASAVALAKEGAHVLALDISINLKKLFSLLMIMVGKQLHIA